MTKSTQEGTGIKASALIFYPAGVKISRFSSIFVPKYFKDMYSYEIHPSRIREEYNYREKWKQALASMVESWRWILERKVVLIHDGWEDVPEEIYYGLHLFAEYLPEMQND